MSWIPKRMKKRLPSTSSNSDREIVTKFDRRCLRAHGGNFLLKPNFVSTSSQEKLPREIFIYETELRRRFLRNPNLPCQLTLHLLGQFQNPNTSWKDHPDYNDHKITWTLGRTSLNNAAQRHRRQWTSRQLAKETAGKDKDLRQKRKWTEKDTDRKASRQAPWSISDQR